MLLKDLLTQIEEKTTAFNALLDKDPAGLSLDDASQMKTLDGDIERLNADATQIRSVEALRQKQAARVALAVQPVNPLPVSSLEPTALAEKERQEVRRVFATPHLSKAKWFKERDGKSAEEWAYRTGMWLLAECKGWDTAKRYCKEHGIGTKAHVEDVQAQGGLAF